MISQKEVEEEGNSLSSIKTSKFQCGQSQKEAMI